MHTGQKGQRSALLREKVSIAASSSWSQTELLSRPGIVPHEEQQEERKAARAGGGGLGKEARGFYGTKQEQGEPRGTQTPTNSKTQSI